MAKPKDGLSNKSGSFAVEVCCTIMKVFHDVACSALMIGGNAPMFFFSIVGRSGENRVRRSCMRLECLKLSCKSRHLPTDVQHGGPPECLRN